MAKPIRVLVGGSGIQDRLDLVYPRSEQIVWMLYVPDGDLSTTDAEKYLQLKRVLQTTDILILDVRHGEPSFDEGVILQTAYSNQTPIFLIGDCSSSGLLRHIKSNTFLDPQQVIEHIVDNYV